MSKAKVILYEIENWSSDKKIKLCEGLMLNLTICSRSVEANDETSDNVKVERMKSINEIHHKLINRLNELRYYSRNELNLLNIIDEYIRKDKEVAGEIGAAIVSSYESSLFL